MFTNHSLLALTNIAFLAGFNEFIHERETKPANDPAIMLFDQIILAKRNRGRKSFFGKSTTNFLLDTSDHLWRSAAATPPNGRFPGDYRSIVSRSMCLDSNVEKNLGLLLTMLCSSC